MSETPVPAPRILVVDDEVSSAEVVALILKEEGYEVSFAVDSRQAQALLDNQDFDLLITDFMMPGLNGADLARSARATARHAGLPVMMMSGAPLSALHEQTDTFDMFLRKPFVIEQLLRTVQALLTRDGAAEPPAAGSAAEQPHQGG